MKLPDNVPYQERRLIEALGFDEQETERFLQIMAQIDEELKPFEEAVRRSQILTAKDYMVRINMPDD